MHRAINSSMWQRHNQTPPTTYAPLVRAPTESVDDLAALLTLLGAPTQDDVDDVTALLTRLDLSKDSVEPEGEPMEIDDPDVVMGEDDEQTDNDVIMTDAGHLPGAEDTTKAVVGLGSPTPSEDVVMTTDDESSQKMAQASPGGTQELFPSLFAPALMSQNNIRQVKIDIYFK